MRDDFAVFIITHGRAGNISTLGPLRAGNYTGKLYFLIDNEDEQEDEYRRLYGDENVIVFDKQKAYDECDTMELTGEKRAIVFARNAIFEIARDLGLRYFLMLEDDFTNFMYRFPDGEKLGYVRCKRLDELFEAMIEFLNVSGAKTVALAQGGDFIQGIKSQNLRKGLLRKAMNSFFCDVEKPIVFRGTMNEDVTTYTTLGSRGDLFFTVTKANIVQKMSQSVTGGMTEVYRDGGTYQKTFYSIMSMPSCIKLSLIGDKHMRLHHNVSWNNCVPKILDEKWRKNNAV